MPRLSQLDRSIRNRVALVTGAASGMGRATAHLFADEGAAVVVLDRNESGVTSVVEEIHEAGGTAWGIALDVTDAKAVAELPARVRAELGPLDILVNNAGVSTFAPITDEDYEAIWQQALEVNLSAQVRLIRAFLEDLKRDGEGRIVNVASTEGLGATALGSPYTASKHAVVGLTRSLAVELGRQGVTVNCICPGPIHTGMTAVIPDPMKEKFARRRVPLGRYGEPEEVAHATLGLVLPASSFMTGAVVVVDGGLTVQNT